MKAFPCLEEEKLTGPRSFGFVCCPLSSSRRSSALSKSADDTDGGAEGMERESGGSGGMNMLGFCWVGVGRGADCGWLASEGSGGRFRPWREGAERGDGCWGVWAVRERVLCWLRLFESRYATS